jgi:hypothetical protein
VALLGVSAAALLMQRYAPRLLHPQRKDGVLLLTLDGVPTTDAKDMIQRDISDRVRNGRLESISYAENLTSMYFSFTGSSEDNFDGLHAALTKIASVHKLNVFFNAHGA